MANRVQRPENLPDFECPPLNEVVLGVQFSRVDGFRLIDAGHVWDLFRANYPKVEEKPPLEPIFETFGLPQSGRFGIEVLTDPVPTRFWFLSEGGQELIQFQVDRLIHNWRKVGDGSNNYPRFETMIKKFRDELTILENYFQECHGGQLRINQCEISYINHIHEEDENQVPDPAKWISLLNPGQPPETYNLGFRYVIHGGNNEPVGRLHCEVTSGIKTRSKRLLILNLTARGAPSENTISSALDFICNGRIRIVDYFATITTPLAHKHWGRVQ